MGCLGADSIFNQWLIWVPLFKCLTLLENKQSAYLCVAFERRRSGVWGVESVSQIFHLAYT